MKKVVFVVLLVVLVSSIIVFAQYRQTAPFYYNTDLSLTAIYPSMCNMIKPVRESPNCFVQGLLECARINKGVCFTQCTQAVKISCFDKFSDAPTCELKADFFRIYNDRSSCYKAVDSLCKERCVDPVNNNINKYNYEIGRSAFEKCKIHGIGKCSRIGRQLV